MVLEQLAVYSCPLLSVATFNVHVDRSDDKHAAQLLQLLQTFDMVQHVTEPTHIAGHTLDLVITSQDIPSSTVCTSLHPSPITRSSSSPCMPRSRPRPFSVSPVEHGDGCPRKISPLIWQPLSCALNSMHSATQLLTRWFNCTGQSPLSYWTCTVPMWMFTGEQGRTRHGSRAMLNCKIYLQISRSAFKTFLGVHFQATVLWCGCYNNINFPYLRLI